MGLTPKECIVVLMGDEAKQPLWSPAPLQHPFSPLSRLRTRHRRPLCSPAPCLQHNGGCYHRARQVGLGGPEASHGTPLAPRAAQRPAWAAVCSHGSGLLSQDAFPVLCLLLLLEQTTSCLSKNPHAQDTHPQYSPVHAHILAACFCRFPVHVLTVLSRFACIELYCWCCRELVMQNMIGHQTSRA